MASGSWNNNCEFSTIATTLRGLFADEVYRGKFSNKGEVGKQLQYQFNYKFMSIKINKFFLLFITGHLSALCVRI